jgi:dTDP-4-amino-4,6-dideoxygalactose transaminase
MKVPFLDLHAHHAPHLQEYETAIRSVIASGAFAGGPFVAEFEQDFAAYCQASHAVGVGSGTEALWLSLLACGLGSGDEVITSPGTFLATAEAISYCGARPVFVDIDEQTYTLDPAHLEAAITEKTRAIVPVHLFGQMADMDPIMAVARKYGLFVVEDACQVHGAEYKGHRAGSMGDAGCFSFYPGKNLGAFGEAGAVVTQKDELAQTLQALRDHGQSRKYHHTKIGWNSRMDGIQGAVLQIKLRHLDNANARRRAHATLYDELLRDVEEVVLPIEAPYAFHVYHIYAIRVSDREGLMTRFHETGIGCGVHYPIPVHLQEAYRSLGHGVGDFPIAEQMAQEFISLPMYPELTQVQIERVAEQVKDFCCKGSVAVEWQDRAPCPAS